MVFITAIVLPGIGLAENTTVSPERIFEVGMFTLEIRVIADINSP